MKNLQEEGTQLDTENRNLIEDLQKENDWLSAFKEKYVEQERDLKELKDEKSLFEKMYSQMANQVEEQKLQLVSQKSLENESQKLKRQMEVVQLENTKLKQMVERQLNYSNVSQNPNHS